MTRIVLSPHIAGWGHRIRSDTIARRLLQLDPGSRVTILVPPDDPVDPSSWTALPTERSTLARTLAIVRAELLVQDGAWKYDFRVRLMTRTGGRFVLIGQPYRIDMPKIEAMRVLDAAERIIVPWPKSLLELTEPLVRFREKVVSVNPVINTQPPPGGPSGEIVVYVAVSRGSNPVLESIRGGIQRVSSRLSSPAVVMAGGLGKLLPRDEHSRLFGRASVVISQAPTAVFEAMALGIPVLMLPLAGNEEHQRLASDLKRHKAGLVICEEEVTPAAVEEALVRILTDENLRRNLMSNGRSLVPGSGLDEVVAILLGLATGESHRR